jgi:plastocyanin
MRARALAMIAGLSTVIWMGVPVTASAASAQTFTIGVDHLDPANQQVDPITGPVPGGRVFLYTDFFTRSVKVHKGDTLDFNFAIPDHVIALAPNEKLARQQNPLFSPDEDPNALGSGGPKIELQPLAFAGFFGGPTCGTTHDGACPFDGSGPSAVGFVGPPPTPETPPVVDWFIKVDASPGQSFTYFCHLHPGMRGTVSVVPSNVAVQTQSQIDQKSEQQFQRLRAEAMALYDEANQADVQQQNSGPRTFTVHVGVTSEDRHIAIHDMLPQSINLRPGDRVKYVWQSNVIHTVGFTDSGPPLNDAFGADCYPNDPAYVNFPRDPTAPPPACAEPEGFLGAEAIGDPGTKASGSALTRQGGADSGLLLGADYAQYYGAMGSDRWAIKASDSGTFNYKCDLHEWMIGTITVRN